VADGRPSQNEIRAGEEVRVRVGVRVRVEVRVAEITSLESICSSLLIV